MFSFDVPFFVNVRLSPKKELNARDFAEGKMAEVLEKLQEEKVNYLLVVGNVAKLLPFWKIGSIVSLTKEYASKVKGESQEISLDEKTLKFLRGLDVALVVSFKEENDIEKDLSDYMKGTLSKECLKVSVNEIKDLESMIKLYKEAFDVESVELLKLQ